MVSTLRLRQAVASMRGGAPRQTVILLTRYPRAGATKTRLIPALGAEGAAQWQRRMTARITACLRRATLQRPLRVKVCYAGGCRAAFEDWLGPDLTYEAQAPGDLGARMAAAFQRTFDEGNEAVLIVGADVPALTEKHIFEAFDALRDHDVVLGPTADGGYYLIGLRRIIRPLFEGIHWGSETVFAQTTERMTRLGLRAAFLELLHDVDRPGDLQRWEAQLRSEASAVRRPSISVVIPALDEAAFIGKAVAAAFDDAGVEVIVVDGGSVDRTREIAQSYGARVMTSPPGRAKQMNAGGKAARGEILVFLHADTLLPPGYADAVRRAMAQPRTVGGAFGFRLDDSSGWLFLVEALTNFRSKVFREPYGDQAIFLRSSVWRAIGGYPDVPILEDLILIRRLRRHGCVRTLPEAAITSARRWRRLGVLRTFLIHRGVVGFYRWGVRPETIAAWLERHGYYAPRPERPRVVDGLATSWTPGSSFERGVGIESGQSS